MKVQLIGLDRLLKKTSPELVSGPLRKFFQRTTITVQSKARVNAPSDTGDLRNRIQTEVDEATPPAYGKVGLLNAAAGTPLFKKATALEFGTGLLAEGPNAKGGRHFPPGEALDLWARRHGFQSGWQVSIIIGRRGGLRPVRYLRNALKHSLPAIQGFIKQLGAEIREAWDKQ